MKYNVKFYMSIHSLIDSWPQVTSYRQLGLERVDTSYDTKAAGKNEGLVIVPVDDIADDEVDNEKGMTAKYLMRQGKYQPWYFTVSQLISTKSKCWSCFSLCT